LPVRTVPASKRRVPSIGRTVGRPKPQGGVQLRRAILADDRNGKEDEPWRSG
jgi:hypothetical protein